MYWDITWTQQLIDYNMTTTQQSISDNLRITKNILYNLLDLDYI